jgi:SAM-dependent methyltransferase
VNLPNAAQLAHWSGAGGEQWVAEAARYDRMNRRFGERIVSAVAARAGEHVLDVGCGNGALALAVAPQVAPAGDVVGLDLSRPMLAEARRRADAAGLGNTRFDHGDAQVHPVPEAAFDVVMSRFGVMFFADPAAAFANLAHALRPGGRLVFGCWQSMFDNAWVMVPAIAALEHVPPPALDETGDHGAFSLADLDATTALLSGAGLADITVAEMRAPMWMGSSIDDTVAFMQTTEFADTLFADLAPAVAAAGWNAVAQALEDHVTGDGVELDGAAWLVTARRPD